MYYNEEARVAGPVTFEGDEVPIRQCDTRRAFVSRRPPPS